MPEKKKEKIEFRAEEAIKNKVLRLSAEEHRSESDAAREAVRRYFDGLTHKQGKGLTGIEHLPEEVQEVLHALSRNLVKVFSGHHRRVLEIFDQVADKDKFLESFEGFTKEWIEREDNFIKQATESAEKPGKSSTGKRKS